MPRAEPVPALLALLTPPRATSRRSAISPSVRDTTHSLSYFEVLSIQIIPLSHREVADTDALASNQHPTYREEVMKIAVIGGTGMVGSATVTEAAGRGHEVVSASRSGRHTEGAAQDVTLTLADTQAVVDLINGSDATVITVSAGRGESAQPVIDAHRALIAAAPSGRLIVVGGAGSLLTPDGTRLVDTPGFPEEYKPEALAFTEVLDLYREAGSALTWTFLSPAPEFTDKPRTGTYTEGADQPAGSEISVADFAVALVDEAEKDAHRGRRWTIASA